MAHYHVNSNDHVIALNCPYYHSRLHRVWHNLSDLYLDEILARNSNNHWTEAILSLKRKRIDIGNKQHHIHGVKLFRPVLYKISVNMVGMCIKTPLKCCGMPGGFAFAFDGGQMGPNKVEYIRVKFFYDKWCIFLSCCIRVHQITYDETDITTQETGTRLAHNKEIAVRDIGVVIQNAPDLCYGASADTIYHLGHRQVLNKMIKLFKINGFFY